MTKFLAWLALALVVFASIINTGAEGTRYAVLLLAIVVAALVGRWVGEES